MTTSVSRNTQKCFEELCKSWPINNCMQQNKLLFFCIAYLAFSQSYNIEEYQDIDHCIRKQIKAGSEKSHDFHSYYFYQQQE